MEIIAKMKKGIIVLDADKKSSHSLSDMLVSRDYRVTGSWKNPQVERIKREPPEPATPRAVR